MSTKIKFCLILKGQVQLLLALKHQLWLQFVISYWPLSNRLRVLLALYVLTNKQLVQTIE